MLLGGLCLVAFSNGLLLGLSLYGALAFLTGLVGIAVPPPGFAVLGGACAGVTVIALAATREKNLRAKPEAYLPGVLRPITDPTILRSLARLVDSSSLEIAPTLHALETSRANAFSFGRSRREASIVLTRGLLDLLPAAEIEAVLAHELARIEAEDVRVVGFADAISARLDELGRLKGWVLWSPKRIVLDMAPIIGVSLLTLMTIELLPLRAEEQMNFGDVVVLLLLMALYLGLLLLWFGSALTSGRGIAQLFLLVTLFGPLTIVEWLLAPPTAVVISRLVSRTRIFEADCRGVELSGGSAALVSALDELREVESSVEEYWQGERRFALLVKPHAQSGYRALLEQAFSTHPFISERIGKINEAAQERPLAKQPATAP